MIRRFFIWLFHGWFRRPQVGALESFLLRAFLAVIVAFSLRLPVKDTTEPSPVGILAILHKIDGSHPWLTWLSTQDAAGNFPMFDLWRAIIFVLLAFYVAGVALPLVLPAVAVMHTLPFTLMESQGFTYHGAQIISLLLLTQAGTVIYSMVADRRLCLGPPHEALRGRLLWLSVTIIAGTYFVSVITKIIESKGMWLANANYFALDMVKAQRQTWLNDLSPKAAEIPSNAMWMLLHPWTARLVFGSGIFLEAATVMAIGNRLLAFVIGVSLIIMHRCIAWLMGDIAFANNEFVDLTFFVGVPFGIAWLMERSLSPRACWAFVAGALLALPLSWFLFHPGPDRISSGNFYGYLQAMVNCLDLWTAQDWVRTWRQSGALVVMVPVCGAVGALFAAAPQPSRASSKCLLEAAADGLEDLDAGELLVVPGHNGPRRILGAGPSHHVIDGGLVGVPLLAVAPVLVVDLVLLEGDLLALLEAAQLFLLADVHPELHHHQPVVGELLFKSKSARGSDGPVPRPWVRRLE